MVGGAPYSHNGPMADTILRWRPGEPAATVVGHLPSARFNVAAVWTGEEAYLYGGNDRSGQRFAEILRFTPETGLDPVPVTRIPGDGSYDGGIAWDQGYLYVYGGSTSGRPITDIYRYSPLGGVELVGSTGPCSPNGSGVRWMGSAAVPGGAYIVGGRDSATDLSTICKLTWNGGRVQAKVVYTVPSDVYPHGIISNAVVWDGTYIYVVGGGGTGDTHDTIFRYDPKSNTGKVTCASLPEPRREISAVATGPGAIAVFGGNGQDLEPWSSIVALRNLDTEDCTQLCIDLSIDSHVAVGGLQRILPTAMVGLQFTAGRRVLDVAGSVSVARNPICLSGDVPAIHDPTDVTGGSQVYVRLPAIVPDSDARVRIEIESAAVDLPESGQPAVHLYDGDVWVDLSTRGAGEAIEVEGQSPVVVHEAGYSVQTRKAWAVVNQAGLYALGTSGSVPRAPEEQGAPVVESPAPGVASFLVLFGVAGFALCCRRVVR